MSEPRHTLQREILSKLQPNVKLTAAEIRMNYFGYSARPRCYYVRSLENLFKRGIINRTPKIGRGNNVRYWI